MQLSDMYFIVYARRRARACTAAAIMLLAICARAPAAQVPASDTVSRTLTLPAALSAALGGSPDIAAAREAALRARGLERQSAARANPSLSYNREQVGSGPEGSRQDILEVEQPLEIGGARGARIEAARLRREAAEARARNVEVQVAYDVTVAFALTLAAERRAVLAAQLTDVFSAAERVASRRLNAGDISGFAARRIRLEATRYSVQTAEAHLASRTARLSLFALLPGEMGGRRLDSSVASIRRPMELVAADSVATLALTRPDLSALALERRAAEAEAARARRERTPIPIVSVGGKRESAAGGSSESGLVAGLRMPLPLWDRRGGSIDASDADVRGAAAELKAAEIRARREIREAADALRTAGQQLDLLTPQVSADAMATLRSAQVAYAEGDISLVEWLDAARAYYEVEASLADLRSEYLVRAARLQLALGTTLVGQIK